MAKANVKRLQSAVKFYRNSPDGGDKARKALKEAEEKVEALMMCSTPDEGGFQAARGITLEECLAHFQGLPSWPMVALPPGPQDSLTQEKRLVLY